MKVKTGTLRAEDSFRKRVRQYQRKAKEIEKYLIQNPLEWGKFQVEFNAELSSVFQEIMDFEKKNIALGNEDKIYKLKRLFISKIRSPFERGEYIKWVLKKPYGYAGDFKYIEDIYENNPTTTGFDRLFDNYTMMSSISTAVRNRKNDFKRKIVEYVSRRQKRPLRIMDLASGPCREIYEMMIEHPQLMKKVTVDCYDSDNHSIKFAKKRLKGYKNVNFILENAARIAFRKNIKGLIDKKYDVIYSTGLFDYFEEKIAFRLIQNLKKLLNRGGMLMISDVRDKFSNSSLYFMEWVGDWDLVYRNDEDFRGLFVNAGFNAKKMKHTYEHQGILQYVFASV